MKKLTAMLLALALMTLCCAGFAEAVKTPMPEVGDVVNGFELVETHDYKLIGGRVYRFVHQKTGGELFYIANDDTNRFFQLSFRTQAIDDTGLPHVFEHATLDGSDKYPSKALFFNLANGSYNTYINAFTDKNNTSYPLGSLSEAQLLKLADFYVDSCFHPSLMHDESIYREEAWRYRLDDPDGELTIEGTVYSEMLGATTIRRSALHDFLRLAQPGAYCGNDSGGVPEYIPDMTYEALKSYHDLYYHPSNSVSFLYGKFDDYAAFVKLLDDAFSKYDAQDFVIEEPDYTPITGPVEGSYDFPVEAGSDDQDAGVIHYGTVLPGLKDDREASMAFDTLTSLMNDSASNLHRAVEKAFPKAAFGFETLDYGPDRVFTAVFQHVNPEDAPALRNIMEEGLRDIAENGFSQDMIDAAMASLEISSRLTTESDNLGLSVFEELLQGFITFGDPWYYVEETDALKSIDQWNSDGTYQNLVKTWLMDSDLTVLTTTRPVPGMKEQNDAALAEKLAEIKAGMSEDELNAIIEASHAEDEDDADTAQMLADLTAVTVASLPEEIRNYAIADEVGEDGVRRIDVTANVDGIGDVVLLLDTAGVAQEDLQWMKTYINVIGQMSTDQHDYQTLDTLTTRYMYGLETALLAWADKDARQPMLCVSWLSLDDELAEAYDLAREILYDTDFSDTERLLELVQGLRSSIKANITASPYSELVRLGLSKTVPFYALSEQCSGLGYYDFLGQLETMIEEDPQAVTEKFQAIRQYFFNNAGLILGYVGSAAGIAANRTVADAFAASLDNREIVPQTWALDGTEAASEALIVDSAVQYNGITLDQDSLGVADFDARVQVINALIEDLYLYPQLRDQYGAYGVGLSAVAGSGEYVYSYRDPNVAQTFEVYDALPEFLENVRVEQSDIDRYILSVYTSYAMPQGELTGAEECLKSHVFGHESDETLERMRAVKSVTPETVAEFADYFRNFVEKGYRYTGGGAAAINANAELYDSILNPFGAVDKSQQALSDVPEDSDYYEAVRFAFENGLMDAQEDGSFGVDAPATQGDLAVALMSVLGEALPAQEAFDTLVSYGVMDGEASPEAELTAEECETTLQYFTAAIGLESPGEMTAGADTLTRGDLAQTLQNYMGWLDSLEEAA